jgi:plasmid stabilization system protein ParE
LYYAQLFVQKIFQSVRRLTTFPESGRKVPEIGRNEIREIIVGNYRIIYRSQKQVIEILTVYHSSKLLNKDFIDN